MSAPPRAIALIGRDDELSRLETLVSAGAPLVTVTGAGGTGKTSLLAAFAARLLEGELAVPCDEVIWVDAGAGQRLETELGLRSEVTPGELAAHLASRGCAFVFYDGAEDLSAGEVDSLLTAAPQLTVLVGMRGRLGLASEQIVELAGLAARHGAELLGNLASSRGVGAMDADGVASLVRAVDGHPLALQVCASRLSLMTPSRLAARIEARGAGALPRLGDSLQDGIDALDAGPREALRALTAFASTFTFDAAEAVLGDAAFDALDVLRKASMLVSRQSDGVVQLQVLRPIQDLAGPASDAHLRAHAGYYKDKAIAWFAQGAGKGRVETRRQVSANHSELVALILRGLDGPADAERLDAAAAAMTVLTQLPETVGRAALAGWGAELVARAAGVDTTPEVLGWAAVELATLQMLLGDVDSAWKSLRTAQAWAATGTDSCLRLWVVATGGILLRRQRRLEEAVQILEGACEEARATQSPQRYRIEGTLALAYLTVRRFEDARDHFLACIEGERTHGNLLDGQMRLGNLATAYHRLGKPTEARACLTESIAAARKLGDGRGEGFMLGSLAEIHLRAGEMEEAAARFAEALEVLRDVGDGVLMANFLVPQATLMWLRGRTADARRCLARSEALLERAPVATLRVRSLLAEASLTWPPDEAAMRLLGEAESAAIACHDTRRAVIARLRLATGKALAGDLYEPVITPDDPLLAAVARFYEAQARGDRDEGRRLLAGLETQLVPGRTTGAPAVQCDTQVRVAAHHLRAWLECYVAPDAEDVAPLELDGASRRARPPGGEWCDLETRSLPWRLLEVLADRRLASPGTPVSLTELLPALWPGEAMVRKSGRARLYTAVAALRREGFRDVLLSNREGYYLDPDVPLVRERLSAA
jgi:tetratricopeptide (TPR) repeat protein